MQQRLIELQLQRGRLIERIATQRNALSRQLTPLDRVFNVGDRISFVVRQGWAFLLQHPLVLAAAAGGIVLFKPRSLLRWTQRGVRVWRTWRTVRALLPSFLLSRFGRQR